MPPRNPTLRLRDILDAARKNIAYTQGMTKSQLEQSSMALDAIVHNFAVIGEAAKHVPASIKEAHPEIPWSDILGMRNMMVHEYFHVDIDVMWSTIHDDLPPLVDAIASILKGLDGPT